MGEHDGADRHQTGRCNTRSGPPSDQLCSWHFVGYLVQTLPVVSLMFWSSMSSLKSVLAFSTRALTTLKKQVNDLFYNSYLRLYVLKKNSTECCESHFSVGGADFVLLQTHVIYIKRTLLLTRQPLFKRADGKNRNMLNLKNIVMTLDSPLFILFLNTKCSEFNANSPWQSIKPRERLDLHKSNNVYICFIQLFCDHKKNTLQSMVFGYSENCP